MYNYVPRYIELTVNHVLDRLKNTCIRDIQIFLYFVQIFLEYQY